MVNVIVAGAAGRMGIRIINIINETEGITLSGAFEHPQNPMVGQDAGMVAGLGEKGVIISGSIDNIIESGDVIIDFTVPAATMSNVKKAVSAGKAMVIGTTGITGDEQKEINQIEPLNTLKVIAEKGIHTDNVFGIIIIYLF